MDDLVSILDWLNLGEKENDGDAKTLTLYLRYWGFSGLWPTTNPKQHTIRYFYPRFVIGLNCVSMAICVYSLIVNPNSFVHWILYVTSMMFHVDLCIKIPTYLFQLLGIQQLCDDLDNIHEGQRLGGVPGVLSMLRKMRTISKLFTLYITGFLHVAMIVFLALMLMVSFGLRRHFLSFQYPCDTSTSPCFEIIVVFEIGLFAETLQLLGFSYLLVADTLFQTWIEFRILNMNLQNIREYAVNRVDGRSESEGLGATPALLSDLYSVVTIEADSPQVTADPSSRPSRRTREPQVQSGRASPPIADVISELTAELWAVERDQRPRSLVTPGERGLVEGRGAWRVKANKMAERKRAIDRAMQLRLVECVQHHQSLLSFAGSIEKLFNPFTTAQLLMGLGALVTLSLNIALVSEWGLFEIATLITGTLLTGELFIITWLAEQIREESSRVKEAIYACDWLDASNSFKRSMGIIISMSNAEVIVRAGGFVPLSLPTFASVMNSCYSHFTTFLSMGNTQKSSQE